MKNIIKISGIGMFCSLMMASTVNAQEACDSTCYSPSPLKSGYKTNKVSGTKVTHNYNDYSVRYEYQTLSCPAGYQGRGGGAGSINERRAIITFNKGGTEIGEWIALSDNCELIPPPPPPPPPAPAPAAFPMSQSYHFTEVCVEANYLGGVLTSSCSPANVYVNANYGGTGSAYGVSYYQGSYSTNIAYDLRQYAYCPSNANVVGIVGTSIMSGYRLTMISSYMNEMYAVPTSAGQYNGFPSSSLGAMLTTIPQSPNRLFVSIECVFSIGA